MAPYSLSDIVQVFKSQRSHIYLKRCHWPPWYTAELVSPVQKGFTQTLLGLKRGIWKSTWYSGRNALVFHHFLTLDYLSISMRWRPVFCDTVKHNQKKKISDLPLGPVYVWRYGAPLGCASKGKGSGWPGRLMVTFSCRGSRQSLIHRNKMVDLRSGKGQTRTCRSVPASDFRESFPSRFNRDVKGVFIRRELLPAHVLFGFVSSSHDTYHLTAAFILPNHPSKLK